MPVLDKKVAIITGGSSGIGLATAKRFVAEGAFVFITGRRQIELDKAVAEIGRNVSGITGDIASLDDLNRIYQVIADSKKKLDIVVANAGFASMVSTMDVTPEHFDKMFDTNARGTFFTVQKALPLMNDGGSTCVLGCSPRPRESSTSVNERTTTTRSVEECFSEQGIYVHEMYRVTSAI